MLIPIGDVNPRERFPWVTYALIAANVTVFYFVNLRPPDEFEAIVYQYALIPGEFRPVTLFTSMFMHADPLHLLGNMLFLWIAGDNVEDRCGKAVFLVFYLSAGAAAGAVHTLSITEASFRIPTLGASGAISAVLGGYLLLFPRHKIRFFYFLFIAAGILYLGAHRGIRVWFRGPLDPEGSGTRAAPAPTSPARGRMTR
jgi:membrane associated rhomboid family serine protease